MTPLDPKRRAEIEALLTKEPRHGNIPWECDLMEAARDLLAALPEWRPIESAPKDGEPMLWLGRFRPFDILPGGGPTMMIVRWSTVMSDGTGYQWIADGFSNPHQHNIDWTHWMPLPEPPA